MIQDERFSRIVEYLKENKTAKLKDISKLNDVSIDTVRRDFEQLEAKGMLRRVRGGAIFPNVDITTQNVDVRRSSNCNQKKEIASLFGDIILDGQAVAFNSGTTCAEIARFLVDNYRSLTIITNNLRAVEILAQAKDFTIIIPGGEVDSKEWAVFGETCEENIMKYNADVAIFGIHAISLEKGITDFRLNQYGVLRAMLQVAKKKIVVADSSKFEKVACVNVCNLEEIDIILSDSDLPEDIKKAYEKKGLKIIVP